MHSHTVCSSPLTWEGPGYEAIFLDETIKGTLLVLLFTNMLINFHDKCVLKPVISSPGSPHIITESWLGK